VAGGLHLDRHADLNAGERIVERDPHARFEIGTALGPRPGGTLTASEERAEVAQDV